jgi:hypothetical protein
MGECAGAMVGERTLIFMIVMIYYDLKLEITGGTNVWVKQYEC